MTHNDDVINFDVTILASKYVLKNKEQLKKAFENRSSSKNLEQKKGGMVKLTLPPKTSRLKDKNTIPLHILTRMFSPREGN